CLNPMGQQLMPDDRSVLFWQLLAAHYKENPAVFLELYNEPRGVSWDCWLKGCTTGAGWHAVGMQTLYETVRRAGFQNLVFVGGLNWARDLSGVPAAPIQGYGVVYATHPYYPDATPDVLHRDFGALTGQYPVVATEFGPQVAGKVACSPGVMERLIAYFDAP